MVRGVLLSLGFTVLVASGYFAFEFFFSQAGESVPGHPAVDGVSDAAARSIAAYGEIQASLDAGKLDDVAKNAEEIAQFFDGVNPLISAKARELAETTEVEDAKTTFNDLTVLFRDSARPSSHPETPETFEL